PVAFPIVDQSIENRCFGLIHDRRVPVYGVSTTLTMPSALQIRRFYGRAHLRDHQTSGQDGCMADSGTVVELRVHGVSGAPPEALLGCAAAFVERTAGDADAGFYRRRTDEIAGSAAANQWRRVMEAYSWGALTSGRASR